MTVLKHHTSAFNLPSEELPQTQRSPEQKFLAGILFRAVLDYLQTAKVEKAVVRDATRWLFSDAPTNHWPITLAFVCQELELDRKSLRRQLRTEKAALRSRFMDQASFRAVA